MADIMTICYTLKKHTQFKAVTLVLFSVTLILHMKF